MIIVSVIFTNDSKAQHSQQGMLSLSFEHYADDIILKPDSTVYKNAFGQAYTITNLKYYISNISLIQKGKVAYKSADHFLVNEEEEISKTILLKQIPEGNYEAISFMIGIDSIHNCSGAQSGALDAVNGMYWTWNSGYIFMKLEGRSPFSRSPGNIFEYHIGGYKAPANCIRIITLKPENSLLIGAEMKSSVIIRTNIAEILRSPVSIDFSSLPAVTDHRNAEMMADNYSDMFTIKEVKDEK
jgi:hypothetical protein